MPNNPINMKGIAGVQLAGAVIANTTLVNKPRDWSAVVPEDEETAVFLEDWKRAYEQAQRIRKEFFLKYPMVFPGVKP